VCIKRAALQPHKQYGKVSQPPRAPSGFKFALKSMPLQAKANCSSFHWQPFPDLDRPNLKHKGAGHQKA
jgi:hypothetical protein